MRWIIAGLIAAVLVAGAVFILLPGGDGGRTVASQDAIALAKQRLQGRWISWRLINDQRRVAAEFRFHDDLFSRRINDISYASGRASDGSLIIPWRDFRYTIAQAGPAGCTLLIEGGLEIIKVVFLDDGQARFGVGVYERGEATAYEPEALPGGPAR